MKTIHWSPSQHLQYLACPRQWWLRRTAQQDEPPDPRRKALSARLGTLGHEGIAAAYAQLRDDRTELPPGARMSVFEPVVVDAMHTAADRLGLGADAPRPHRVQREDVVEEVRRTLAVLPAPHWLQVYAVEETATRVVRVGEEFEVEIELRLDLALALPGRVHVVDWKRRSELGTPRQLAEDIKMRAYAALWRPGEGNPVTVELFSLRAAAGVWTTIPPSRDDGTLAELARTAIRAHTDPALTPRRSEECASCPVHTACPLFAPRGAKIPRPVEETISA